MATVEKRGKSYRITVSDGYSTTGQQKKLRMTWTPEPSMTHRQIEKELERQKVLFEEKCRTGQLLDSSMRFSDFVELWLHDYAEVQLKAKTLEGYQRLLIRILPAIGHIRLCKLGPVHLSQFYANLAESGIRSDKRYACTTDFKQFLKDQKITQGNAAKLSDVSLPTLTNACAGKNVSEETAHKLNAVFGTKLFITVDNTATLSGNTVSHYHRLIASILNVAVQWQVIPFNPCDRVKPPKIDKKPPRYLDEVQAGELLALLEQLDESEYQHVVMIKLLLYTGFRRGELCGLEWGDIDFENRVIHVRRSSNYLAGKGVYDSDAKTASSIRSIKISFSAIEMLREYKHWQIEQQIMLGDQWVNSNRLFTAWNGAAANPSGISCWFAKFVKKNNLPSITIHSLRHTNATLQIAGGVPLSTIADRLGHANTAVTGQVYIHAIRSADERAADTLEDLLHPGAPKTQSKSG